MSYILSKITEEEDLITAHRSKRSVTLLCSPVNLNVNQLETFCLTFVCSGKNPVFCAKRAGANI